MSSIQLICFDLGRVLIRICDNWQHACELAGIHAPVGELDDAARAALFDIVVRSETGQVDLAGFCREASPLLGLSVHDVETLSNSYTLGPYPAVTDLLVELNQRRFQTACLSNTNTNHWRIMFDPAGSHFPAMRRLRYCFASHLIGVRKPDEAIYRHVEQTTGFGAGEIVFFDDLEENVAAAFRRGWKAHQIEVCDDPVRQIRRDLQRHGVL